MTLQSIDQYGPQFQTKVIATLLTHKDFLVNIHDILDESSFGNQANQWIIKEILTYYAKYHTIPSMDVLKVELQKIDNDVLQLSIKEKLREAYKISTDDAEYIIEEFSTFCKNQQLKKALLSSVDLLKAGDYDSIKLMIENAMKAGQDKNMGHEYNKDIESRYREDNRVTIPTPWGIVNDMLQGGLGNGDFGLIFGNPGGGKSWSLVALGGFAIKMGYNVLHYTLELGEDYVGRRYDAFFTNIAVDKVLEHREKVEEVVDSLKGELIIKEFATGRATINTVEAHIAKVKTLGIEPDLIIIDYVDLLSSKRKSTDRKFEIDDIYTSTKGLARELNIPIWSVSQVNRAGSKDDVIEGDKAAGSYDKMMITDFAMSLSRKKEDKVNNTGRFHVMKNRYGLDGVTYLIKADTSTGHFEITDEYDEDDNPTPVNGANSFNNIDNVDRKTLSKKFFELNH
jgi:replicative DNA helicase|tara:strand:+ start:1787 stop:3148 length:1362 start_codon:yes stop_codon:yes gene_type:complete